MILARRRDDHTWQILSATSPSEVRPEGSWDTILFFDPSEGTAGQVVEYRQTLPKWEPVLR